MASKFKYIMNGDYRTLKDTLENLNTRKRTSRRIPTGIVSKNSESSQRYTPEIREQSEFRSPSFVCKIVEMKEALSLRVAILDVSDLIRRRGTVILTSFPLPPLSTLRPPPRYI